QQLEQLGRDALGGQAGHAALQPLAGGQGGGVGLAAPIPGQEAEEAQDAQVVLADARVRVADEDDAAGQRVGDPLPGRVVQAAVAAAGVLGPVGGEGHGGVAAVGGDVAAQAGDLVGPPVEDGGDGAVLDAGGNRAQPRGPERGLGAVRGQGGGDVHVADR